MWTFLLLGLTPFSVAKPTEEDKSKVCWKPCLDNHSIQSVTMTGCLRRSTFPQSEQFSCDGKKSDLRQVGPPCTTMTNRTFYMDVVFDHQGIQEGELVQTAGANALKGALRWSPIELPWVTLPRSACEYLTETEKYVGCNGEAGTSLLHLPIFVETIYPPDTYEVNYYLANKGTQIACVSFLLRICKSEPNQETGEFCI